MMRIHIVLLSVVGVMVAGAAQAASASAHEFLVEGLPLTETMEVEGASGETKLYGELLGTKVFVECTKDKLKGKLETGGNSKGEITFEGCSLWMLEGMIYVEDPNCSVPNYIIEFADALVGTPVEDELKGAKAAQEFGKVKVNGAMCALKGLFVIKGAQVCKIENPENSAFVKEFACAPAGSAGLTLNAEAAQFKATQSLELTSKRHWSAR
jgi:hypothetical protein